MSYIAKAKIVITTIMVLTFGGAFIALGFAAMNQVDDPLGVHSTTIEG